MAREGIMAAFELHRASTQKTSHGPLSYLCHEPPGWAVEPRPLVLFLHGSGERGDDLARVCSQGLPATIERGRNVPFVAVSPQCPEGTSWTPLLPALHELLDALVPALNIDTRRIYLTGISMGAYAAWMLAAQRPERFAALIPVCGGGDPDWAARLAGLPTWVFHGAEDQVVAPESSVMMVKALEQAGGTVRFTLYEGVGHDSWTRAYDEPELYDWMLGQRRAHELVAAQPG
jgi:predicted peptidase